MSFREKLGVFQFLICYMWEMQRMKKLYSMGIRTIGDLAKSDETLLVRNLARWKYSVGFANGYDESPVKLAKHISSGQVRRQQYNNAQGYGNR